MTRGKEPEVWISANEGLALTRLLWDLARSADHDEQVYAYGEAGFLESDAGMPGWPGSPLGDSGSIAYLEAMLAYLSSAAPSAQTDRVGMTREQAAYLAELLWRLSITATSHPNRLHAYHWARFIEGVAGPNASGSPSLEEARRLVAQDVKRQLEEIRAASH